MSPDYESALMQCDQRQLRALLSEVSVRLGTPQERTDDIERARTIAHQLNNLLARDLLRGELDETAFRTPTALPVGGILRSGGPAVF